MNIKPYRISHEVVSTISDSIQKQKNERLCSVNVKDLSVLKAEELRKAFFNSEKDEYNIFISYSYKDKEKALKLAGYIEKNTNKKVFCDCAEWGDYRELLKSIDDEFCKHSNGTSYDYDKRNNSTAHIHMLLASSLFQIMLGVETVIFLDSGNLVFKDDMSASYVEETQSPWIYFEYLLASHFQKRQHMTYDGDMLLSKQKQLTVAHKVDINSFEEIVSLPQLEEILS